MIGQFRDFFRTQSLVLEYSEPFVNKFATRLATQANMLGDIDHIKNFIRFFDTIRNTNDFRAYVTNNRNIFSRNNKPITDVGNIELYNASQLEHIYDQFHPDAKKEKETEGTQQPITQDADLKFPDSPEKTIREINPAAINDDRYLEIYFAGNQEKCTKFSHDVFGKSYNYCIGRKDSSNMYTSYRLGVETDNVEATNARQLARSFYFVRDYSRPFTDDYHLMVVHVLSNGTYAYTNAPNNEEENVKSWAEIVAKQPKLAKHQEIFKYVSLNNTEKLIAAVKNTLPENFHYLTPPLQRAYISAGKPLRWNSFTQLSTEDQSLFLQTNLVNNSINDNCTFSGVHYNDRNARKLLHNIKTALDSNPEWGLSSIYNEDFMANTSDGRGMPLIGVLLLLKLNSKYIIDNEYNLIPRKEERLQPLKYYIKNIFTATNYVIGPEEAKTITNYKFKSSSLFVRFAEVVHTGTTSYRSSPMTIIKYPDKYFIFAFLNKEVFLLQFDLNLNLTHQPAHVVDSFDNGILIDNHVLINFEDDDIRAQQNSPHDEIDISRSNRIGQYSLTQYLGLPYKSQISLGIKSLKSILQKFIGYEEKQAYNVVSDISDLFLKHDFADHSAEDFFKKYATKNTNKKLINPKLIESNYRSPIPNIIKEMGIIHCLCNTVGGELLEYYNKEVHPIFKDSLIFWMAAQPNVDGYGSNAYAIKSSSTSDLFISDSSARDVFLILDVDTFEIKAILPLVIRTANYFVLGEVNKKMPTAKIAFNEKGEYASDEILSKIQDTFTRISKLKGTALADTIITTFLKYKLNPAITKGMTRGTEARSDNFKVLPPFDSKAHVNYKSAIYIDTSNNTELQNKYLTVLYSGSGIDKKSLTFFLNLLKKHGNMQLSAVFVKIPQQYQAITILKFGFLFTGPKKESMFIETNNCFVHTANSAGSDKNLFVWRDRNKFANDFTRAEPFTEKFLKYKGANVYLRPYPATLKSKKATLSPILKLLTVSAGNKNKPESYIKVFQMIQQITGIIPDSSTPMLQDLYAYSNPGLNKNQPKAQNIQEEEHLPFGLYYKLVS